MTTFAAFYAEQDTIAAHVEVFDRDFPGWEDRERFGVTLLDDADFALTEDVDGPTDADWDFFAETMYVDPMERDF